MDIQSLTITIPVAISIGSFVIGLFTFFGNKKRADKNDEARLVRMETMLVKIDENTSDLKNKVDSHDKMLTKHEAKINVLEERIKVRGTK